MGAASFAQLQTAWKDDRLRGVFSAVTQRAAGSSPLALLPDNIAATQIKNFAAATDEGAVSLQKFFASLNDKGMQQYLKSVDAGKASLKDYKNYVNSANAAMQSAGMGARAAAVGIKALNMALNAGVMILLTLAIQGIAELLQQSEKAREQAYNAALELQEETAGIADYKSQISALRAELNDVNTSEERSHEIKQELLSMQTELVEQYGAQLGAIDLVNGSLEKQLSMLDQINKNANLQWKMENHDGITEALNDIHTNLSDDNHTGINGTYADLHMTLDTRFDATMEEETLAYKNAIANFITQRLGGSVSNTNAIFNVKTKAELKEQLEALYAFVENYGRTHKIDTSAVLGGISDAYNYWFDERYEKNKEIVEQWAAVEASENAAYSEIYKEAIASQQQYEDALASGDAHAQEQVIDNMTDLYARFTQEKKKWLQPDAFGNVDQEAAAVAEYFQTLFDSWDTLTVTARVKFDLEDNKDGLQDTLKEQIKAVFGDENVTDADLYELLENAQYYSYTPDGTNKQAELLHTMRSAAQEYGIEVEELIELLRELKIVQSEAAASTPESFGFTALIDSASESFQNASAQLDSVQAAYKSVQSVINDYNETGVLTIDNLQTLLSLGDEYLLSMIDENGQLQLNENAYKRLALAKLDKIKADMLDNAISNLNALENEAAAAEYLKTKTDEVTESKYSLYLATLQEKQAQGGNVAKAANQIDSEVQRMLALFDKTAEGIETNTGLSLGGAEATDAYREALQAQKSALEAEKTALEQTKTALENKKQALEDMKAAYEEDKQSIQSLIDLTMEMQKKQYETQKEQLEKEKEAIREKVDLLKENLHAEKELHDYKKSLEEKTDEITTIEQHLGALGVRDDPEALKRRDELNEELNQARDELTELQYEREMELKEQQLENMYALEEEALDKEIEKIDTILGEEGTLREEAMQLIDGKSQAFYEQLSAYVSTYTTKSNAELQILWNNAYLALDKYTQGHYNTMAVMNLLDWNISQTDQKIANMNTQISQTSSAIATVSSKISSLASAISDYARSLNEMTDAQKKASESAPQLKNYEGYFFGIRYQATAATAREAAQAIRVKMHTNYGGNIKNIMSVDEIEKRLTTYASGTRHAKGGLAIKDENGYELTLDKPAAGRYAVLNEGAVVFTSEQTEKLWELSKNPVRFLSPILASASVAAGAIRSTSVVDSRSQVINPSITIQVQGNATPEGVDALYNNIEKKFFRSFRKILK